MQNRVWVVIYVVFAVLSLSCVGVLWRKARPGEIEVSDVVERAESQLSLKRRLYWVLLAFVPSSLLFGVTSYITTEIAPTPLLWTIPLALYLVTFILAFARNQFAYERMASYALGGLALLLTLVLATSATEPTAPIVLLHLAFFFVAAMLCHHRLASDRPSATRLPQFYLCVAIGGMLGGLFNTLIAPTIFDTIVEYPLLVVIACLIRRRDGVVMGWPSPAFESLTRNSRWRPLQARTESTPGPTTSRMCYACSGGIEFQKMTMAAVELSQPHALLRSLSDRLRSSALVS